MGTSAGRPIPTAIPAQGPGEAGAVTAEAAVVIPVLAAVAVGLTWLLLLASTQVRVVDAAREAARVAARGDGQDAAIRAGSRVAPEGTRFRVTTVEDRIEVVAEVEVDGPGGLFGFLPGVSVQSEAVAVEEPR